MRARTQKEGEGGGENEIFDPKIKTITRNKRNSSDHYLYPLFKCFVSSEKLHI